MTIIGLQLHISTMNSAHLAHEVGERFLDCRHLSIEVGLVSGQDFSGIVTSTGMKFQCISSSIATGPREQL